MNENIHILVVDDNQENLKVVSNYLKEKKYKIALALGGKSALKILASTPIDLVLLDIMMPEMDGFEVCREIKALDSLKDIPIIFLTARSETEDIVKGFELGGVDYVTKPFRPEELLARVNNHVQLKVMRDLLIENIKNIKSSRAEMMRMLIDFAKIFEERRK